MKITSNTKGKVEKILSGSVFNGPFTFINEILQNSYRARSKRLDILTAGNEIIFKDDGCGLKNPESVLTFDLSEWTSTKEGFGVGIWSVFAIPEVEEVSITSRKHRIVLDVEKIKETLEADYFSAEDVKGFEIKIKSPYFSNHMEEIKKEILEKSKTMNFDVYLDFQMVEKVDLFEMINGKFTREFENRLFKAKFAISEEQYDSPTAYYELRKVCKLYDLQYVTGSIEIKKNAVNLKEPDRNYVVYNEKLEKFMEKAENCIRQMYVEFLDYISDDEQEVMKYSLAFGRYLKEKDFEDKIKISIQEDYFANSKKNKSDKSSSSEEPHIEEENVEGTDKLIENNVIIKVPNILVTTNSSNAQSNEYAADLNSLNLGNEKNKESLKKVIQKRVPKFWVESNMAETYQDNISMARYYGASIIEAKTTIIEKYVNGKIPHIKDLEKHMTKEFDVKDSGFSTGKEEYFIKTLSPLIKAFNLPEDIFKVALVSQRTIFTDINGEAFRPKRFEVKAFASKEGITFNRKFLNLYKFNLDSSTDNIGKNELKCLMYHLETISHELAHYLYNTVDNTKYHFEMERFIQNKIADIYVSQ